MISLNSINSILDQFSVKCQTTKRLLTNKCFGLMYFVLTNVFFDEKFDLFPFLLSEQKQIDFLVATKLTGRNVASLGETTFAQM